MIDRTLLNRLSQSNRHMLLLGPRQVGKSTLVQALYPDIVVNMADEQTFLSHSKDPGLFRREMKALHTPKLIVIDEVQRVPSILNTLQALMDEGSAHRFIITGSSARKLKRGQANLLPGRILLEYLDPLSYLELGHLFDLEKALQIGTLPGVYLHEDGADILESYTNIYLREEIQAEAAAKNIGSYARFLDVAAQSSGDWINYSKIASDSEIPKETIRRYYSILEDTLLAFRIPPFKTPHARRRVSHRDRFVFFDVGVRNAILKIHRHPPSPIEKGKLFEQWLLLQCIYHIHALKRPWSIYAYRTDAGAEVDFVIDTGERCLAIECKYGRNATESEMKGLRSFEIICPKPVLKFFVYQGETSQEFSKGELVLPYGRFLEEVLPSY